MAISGFQNTPSHESFAEMEHDAVEYHHETIAPNNLPDDFQESSHGDSAPEGDDSPCANQF